MKKKVLHVAETIKGGVASVLKQLLINDSNLQTISIIPDSQAGELQDIPDINVRTFNRTGRNFKSFANLFSVFNKTIREYQPDIIHIHSSFAGVVCRLALMVMPINKKPKVIYCPHAFSFLMDASVFKKKIYAYIERFLSSKTDAIICTSIYEKNVAIQYGLNKNKLYVVYNGIPEPHTADIFELSPYNNDKINVLFVGRFDYQKGIDVLFNIIKTSGPDFHFTLVGESVHDEFTKLELSSITYAGWVGSKDLAKYYRYADVTLMPSRWESFGLVAAESNSYGTPVIASNTSALPEVIENNITGYLFNIDDFQEAVDILNSKTKKDWFEFDSASRLNYITKFESKKMINKVLSLYQE